VETAKDRLPTANLLTEQLPPLSDDDAADDADDEDLDYCRDFHVGRTSMDAIRRQYQVEATVTEMVESVERAMEQVKEDGAILVPRVFREITDNGDQAIVLAQVFYWFRRGKTGKPRARNIKWGELRSSYFRAHKVSPTQL
jgi:hypothetical protein